MQTSLFTNHAEAPDIDIMSNKLQIDRFQRISIKECVLKDLQSIFELYSDVAAVVGGLSRLQREVDKKYVCDFLEKSIADGASYLAEYQGQVIGEIHTYRSGLYCFSHVLSELTIAVHPSSQGSGVGRLLFDTLMKKVELEMPEIKRIELIARESNSKAIAFYKSLGFVKEGCFDSRIKNVDGSFENDIAMAWLRPPKTNKKDELESSF